MSNGQNKLLLQKYVILINKFKLNLNLSLQCFDAVQWESARALVQKYIYNMLEREAKSKPT